MINWWICSTRIVKSPAFKCRKMASGVESISIEGIDLLRKSAASYLQIIEIIDCLLREHLKLQKDYSHHPTIIWMPPILTGAKL